MTQDEKRKFVTVLSETIASDIVARIDAGKVPAEWDGIELRWLLAERHNDNASMYHSVTPRRKREYKNIVNVNNL